MSFDRKLWNTLPHNDRILILYLMGAPIDEIADAYNRRAWAIKKFLIQKKAIWECPNCGRIYGLMVPAPDSKLNHWEAWESWHAHDCPQFRYDMESLRKEVIRDWQRKRK